jgi:tRNA modification GTPase
MTQTDTIAAIATPLGAAGLGIIRVSGPVAHKMGQLLFRPAHQNCTWQSHRLYHGDIVDAGGATVLDEVLVTLMRKPNSFTGEDVLEISCHGNPLILQTVLEQLITLGCRPARPGEFSERAFLNGRMDLSQAEALAAMISARSSKALQVGLAQLKGSLGREINRIRALVMDALAGIEAAIDFSEDLSGHETPACPPQICEAVTGINRLLSTYGQGRLFTDGIQMVITGKPNVGKSSLLNILAGRKKAIVTNIPGTTRDLITETIQLDGFSVHLTDTAGIRTPMDTIEKEGIDLVRERLEQADVVVILLDGSMPLTDEDRLILKENEKHAGRMMIAVNKSDLPPAWETEQLAETVGPLSGTPLFRISAKFGDGLDALKKALTGLTGGSEPRCDDGMISRLRHKLSLEKTLEHLTAADRCIITGQSPEFTAFELHEALDNLDEITGRKIQDDILHQIFSSFCIGK